uniref:Uncharacterized protein n=1 Tax=Anguilla anguilla TaxID=7936 RepID=A0A0E9V7Q7_ANGAN
MLIRLFPPNSQCFMIIIIHSYITCITIY